MDELLEEIISKLKERIIFNKKERLKLIDTYNLLISNKGIEKKPAYYIFLSGINATYKLGVDMSLKNAEQEIIASLDKLIKLLEYEIAEHERIIATFQNGFNSYVCNIPFMFLEIFINMSSKFELSESFLNQLQANKEYYENNTEIQSIVYQDEKFDGLKDYEIRILEAFEAKDYPEFKALILEYFRYIYKSKTITKLLEASGISVKDIFLKIDDLIEELRVKHFSKRKEIPKKMVNALRNILDESILEDKASMENMLKEIETLSKTKANPTIDTILALNAAYKLNLKMTADYHTIIEALKRAIAMLKVDIEKLKTLKHAISRTGIKNSVLGLPRLVFSIEDKNLAVQYLFLTGIKINGEQEMQDLSTLDDLEQNLFSYEKSMASLINDDYSISSRNSQKFIELYINYLNLYAKFLDDNLANSRGIKSSKRVKGIATNMGLYTHNAVGWLTQDDIEKPVTKTSPIVRGVEVNPLDEFISSGRIIKYCPLEKFKILLEQSGLSSDRQMEYLRAMLNFKNRNIQEIIKQVFKDEFSISDYTLYMEAKSSSDIESINIASDIEAAIMLMLDSHEDERLEFIDECHNYINLLRNRGLTDHSINFPQVLYFKTKSAAPFIIENIEESSFKQVKIALNKILNAKFDGDKDIKGINSSLTFKAKGKSKKIVYTNINGLTIVIGAFNSDEVIDRLNELVVSEEFKKFINDILASINEGLIIDNDIDTQAIMRILNKEQPRH